MMLSLFSYLLLGFAFFVWLGSVLFAVLGRYYRRTERYAPETKRHFNPNVLVILPCKGTDITIGTNMLSLRAQLYDNYRIVGVVDSETDPAVEYMREAGIGYIISDKRYNKCSGKVRNLLSVFEKFRFYDIYVVVDADVTAATDWLSKLITPLSDPSIGVSTTYPYFNPVGGFWSEVKKVWNFVGEGMMESVKTRFVWGGSMAFKRELVDKELLLKMSSAVSDDIEVARACKRRGLRIFYVKEKIACVNVIENFWTFMEWANRQTALSVSANRKLITYGKFIYGAECLLILLGVTLPFFYGPIWFILLIPAIIKMWAAYSKSQDNRLLAIPISIMVQSIYLYNITKAGRMKSIKWRGVEYKLYR